MVILGIEDSLVYGFIAKTPRRELRLGGDLPAKSPISVAARFFC
jgi:hypothetical protein